MNERYAISAGQKEMEWCAPDIHGEQGGLPVMEGVLCIGGLGDLELAAVQHQPSPSGAKLGGSSLGEGFLELLIASQVVVDGLCNGTSGGSCMPDGTISSAS